MRLSPPALVLTAVITAGLLLGLSWLVLRPAGPALVSAEVALPVISPNADGLDDVTRLSYTLRRPARVSIYFIDEHGERFYFRKAKQRSTGEYTVYFSGIVDPYRLPGDFAGEILARVLPDGCYTWVIEAEESHSTTSLSGTLTIQNADTTLPALLNFSASPPMFTPNQDGINDRVAVNVYLTKDIAADGLRVFLIGPDKAILPLSETSTALPAGQRGLHTYDYDGGIDLGVNPPPDGEYIIRAEAVDRLGQKTAVTTTLTIINGGLPRAEILNGEVEFSATTLVVGQTLYFTLTVENYGAAPIRTSGPPAGWVYRSMSENSATLGWYEESGAWRVGINCETCQRDYPWRWALGTPDILTPLTENGTTHYYLLPGQRAVVSGGIVLDDLQEKRNPQYFWAGLIHEDVEIAAINNRVDPHLIALEKP